MTFRNYSDRVSTLDPKAIRRINPHGKQASQAEYSFLWNFSYSPIA